MLTKVCVEIPADHAVSFSFESFSLAWKWLKSSFMLHRVNPTATKAVWTCLVVNVKIDKRSLLFFWKYSCIQIDSQINSPFTDRFPLKTDFQFFKHVSFFPCLNLLWAYVYWYIKMENISVSYSNLIF